MTKTFLLTLAICFVAFTGKAQYQFVEKGRITFERKVNTYAVLPGFVSKSNIAANAEFTSNGQYYRSSNPQFWTDNFQLTFNRDTTLYEPIGPVSNFMNGVGTPVAHANRVYIKSPKAGFIAEKFAYNELKIVEDSIVKIKWKLTAEIREIAGYECRRANALIKDSIYVVAFYTDAIKCSGGPELFSGLPGVILGVVLPHQHISYFATKVDISDVCPLPQHPEDIFAGKKISQQQFDMAVTDYLRKSNQLNSWTRIFMGL
jgi:GLPGLI family protein